MEENTEKILLRAEHLAEIERWSEAVPLLKQALAADPQNARAFCLLSLCHYKLKEFKEALEYAERAVAAEPEEEWGHRLRSVALTETGRKSEALLSAEEAVRLAPEEPLARQTLVIALMNSGEKKRALEIALKSREMFPEMELSNFSLGNVYLHSGSFYEAERCFREALRINPNSSDARNNLGVVLLRRNQTNDNSILKSSDEEEIHRHFVEAVKLEPNHETAAENLRNQFGYAHALYGFLILLPFYSCAFFIAPGMAILIILISFFQTLRSLNEIRQRRKRLAPEMLLFLNSSAGKTVGKRFGEFKVFAENIYRKTWKPHALAVFAVVLCYSYLLGAAADENFKSFSRVAAFILIIAGIFWLQSELSKD